ncbi:hypothetical protein H8A95_26730 [Bradyrhizobium sp. Pear76]|uniref:hypothetical protein n=1 Tax=Bradyrhizobium oropedii TaxID=1571201 RepID=UPI001E480D4C|nr:hypothetical protein [Bradyrhizobium oropedii]MCC8965816.1 hypothetical protein [Bradyrhizobium oropedii]
MAQLDATRIQRTELRHTVALVAVGMLLATAFLAIAQLFRPGLRRVDSEAFGDHNPLAILDGLPTSR